MVGAGKVATHLSRALAANGHHIAQVYSQTEVSAQRLATHHNCKSTTELSQIEQGADLYILALNENGINHPDMPHWGDSLVVHTSGSTPLSAIRDRSTRTGVFYPLQTFSLIRDVDFTKVPLCIEAEDETVEEELTALAKSLSTRVEKISSEERKQLHLAAVFVNNFANHLWTISESVAKEANLPYDLLHPLLEETAAKALAMSPHEAQTGPAIRNNRAIIEGHLNLLAETPNAKNIYNLVSQSIFEAHGND